MKKLFGKSFLALVLALTMLMGMSMNVMAKNPATDGMICNSAPQYENPSLSKHGTGGCIFAGNPFVPQSGAYCKWECSNFTSSINSGGYLTINHTNAYADSCPYCGWTKGGNVGSTPTSTSSHTHSYEWETLLEPTTECDGEEAYVCSCGDVEMKQPLSAALYTLRLNEKAIKNAKAGATVVVDVKRFNSLPKWFVEKLVERNDLEITLKFTYNHDNYALNVPKTATIEDESIAWYGPLKLLSMFSQK